MKKLEQINEGKAKKVIATDDPEEVNEDNKDDATAFNGEKKGTITGKGVINNRMTNRVFQLLEKEGIPMAEAEITMIPQNYVTLSDENDIKFLNRTLDLLDEDDDVQAVYHNWDE